MRLLEIHLFQLRRRQTFFRLSHSVHWSRYWIIFTIFHFCSCPYISRSYGESVLQPNALLREHCGARTYCNLFGGSRFETNSWGCSVPYILCILSLYVAVYLFWGSMCCPIFSKKKLQRLSPLFDPFRGLENRVIWWTIIVDKVHARPFRCLCTAATICRMVKKQNGSDVALKVFYQMFFFFFRRPSI